MSTSVLFSFSFCCFENAAYFTNAIQRHRRLNFLNKHRTLIIPKNQRPFTCTDESRGTCRYVDKIYHATKLDFSISGWTNVPFHSELLISCSYQLPCTVYTPLFRYPPTESTAANQALWLSLATAFVFHVSRAFGLNKYTDAISTLFKTSFKWNLRFISPEFHPRLCR